MRAIEFRGQRVDNREWVCGYLYIAKDGKYEISHYNCALDIERYTYEVNPATVGQFTGLRDKNGAKIFEGDVVKCVSLANDHHQYGAITYSAVEYFMGNACLAITHIPIYPLMVTVSLEVIGNRFDNPELLGGAV